MSDTIVVNLTSYPEDISVNLSTEVTEISTNLVETTLTFLQGAGLHRENVFTEDNTFQKDVYVGENLTVSGTISASEYLNLPQPDLSQYLPISGGTITGNLSVSGTTTIPHISGNTSLSGSLNITQNLGVSGVATIPHISGNTSLSGDLSITGNLDVTGRASVDNVTFDQTPELAGGVGVLRWNDTDGTLDLGLKGGAVTLQLGQKEVVRVVNKTDENLLQSDYKVVRIRLANEGGAQGQRLAVVLAQGNNDPDSVTTLGVVSENIANNQEGFITTFGHVRNIDTTGSPQGEIWVDGDVLYLSPTVAGGLTNNKPQAPNHVVVIGYVEYAHQNNGKLFIKIDNGYELDELHNVRITEPQNQDVLAYNSDFGVWENSNTLSNYLRLDGGEINGYLVVNGDYLTVNNGAFTANNGANLYGNITIDSNTVNWTSTTTTLNSSNTTINGSSLYVNVGSVDIVSSSINLDAENTVTAGGYDLNINSETLNFNSVAYTYSAGSAAAHRDALGSGAVGDQLFTSETQAAAQTALGILPMSVTNLSAVGSGNIPLPTGAKFVSFVLIGGGGGGGSGSRSAVNVGSSGGAGGRAGLYTAISPTAVTEFTWPLGYTVGAGGNGGAAVTADTTFGANGSNGTASFLTNNGVNVFTTAGGNGGAGGFVNASGGNSLTINTVNGLLGSGVLGPSSGTSTPSNVTNSVTFNTTNTLFPTSGGAAGGISSGNIILLAGSGTPMGVATGYSVNGGFGGQSGTEQGKNGNTALALKTGTGGGGGIATAGTFAGNRGGNGGLYGGGGGGGSASRNGQASGAGGNGASGLVQVTFYY